MNRLHVHVAVADLDRSVAFYSTLFGAAPSVIKEDYAKWMLDDLRVNFAISAGAEEEQGVRHLGIQAETAEELKTVYGRLQDADRPVLEQGRTTCCYAKSEKSWISDPDGLVWEAFFTDGESTVYGDSPVLSTLAADSSGERCCSPASPAAAEPAAERCCVPPAAEAA